MNNNEKELILNAINADWRDRIISLYQTYIDPTLRGPYGNEQLETIKEELRVLATSN